MKKIILLITAMAVFSTTADAKNYLSFKKNQNAENSTTEEFVAGKAIQTSKQANSTVKFYAEKSEVGSKEIIAWLSITLDGDQTESTVFDPENINCTAMAKDNKVVIGVHNPENYKLTQEKKAKNKNTFWTFGNELSSNVGTVQYTNSKNNEYKEKLAELDALNAECLQISTLNNDTKAIEGKVIFFPKQGSVGRYDALTVVVNVGEDTHTFECECSVIKI